MIEPTYFYSLSKHQEGLHPLAPFNLSESVLYIFVQGGIGIYLKIQGFEFKTFLIALFISVFFVHLLFYVIVVIKNNQPERFITSFFDHLEKKGKYIKNKDYAPILRSKN